MFLWRSVAGALAVSDRLRTRGIQVDVVCKLCQSEPETINHVRFTCSVAKAIWSIVGVPRSSIGFSTVFATNLSYVLDLLDDMRLSEEVRVAIPWVLWCVWNNRNSVLYAQSQTALNVVVQQALEESLLWHSINDKVENVQLNDQLRIRRETRWQAPMEGSIKCNVNSNWRNATLHSGGAWMARDSSGLVLLDAQDAFTSSPNRITSELRYIIWAMTSLRDIHLRDVIFALDCKAAFEAINNPSMWPRYRILLARINSLRLGFDCSSFELESVQTNGTVRAIAASVTRDGRFNSYLAYGGPAWLHDLIAREASS